jgi:carbon storage regulator
MIGDNVEISVLSVMGEKVRIGIAAPRDVPIFRTEVYLSIQSERDGNGNGEADVDQALQTLAEPRS